MKKSLPNLTYRMMKVVILSGFFIFGAWLNTASAQCMYLKISPEGQSSAVLVSCDFPVLDFEKATQTEKEVFTKEVESWKKTHPGFEGLSFQPSERVEFIQISKADFNGFDEKRKSILLSTPTFYHIQQ